MTRDEYLEMLATEPATPTQVGAIQGEFGRLGVADRGERLAVSAALLGLDSLGSTTDLVMGQAGQLVSVLQRARDRGELPEVTAASADDGQGGDGPAGGDGQDAGMPLGEAILRIAALIVIACAERGTANLNEVGQRCHQIRST